MRQNKETAQRGNAGGKVNHRQKKHNTAAALAASRAQRCGANVGEAILIALALGVAAGRGAR
jgi:hypothetical protein